MKLNTNYKIFFILIFIFTIFCFYPHYYDDINEINKELINKKINLAKNAEIANYSIFLDDFESYSVNSFPSNYTLKEPGAGSNFQNITDVYAANGSQSFTLKGNPGFSSSIVYREITYSSKNLAIDAYLMAETPVSSNIIKDYNLKIGFYKPSVGTYGEFYASIGLKSNGNITVEGGVSTISLVSYEAFKWQHVELYLNLTENTIKTYVNDTYFGQYSLTKNASLTTAIGITSETYSDTGYIDDLSVYSRVVKGAPNPPSDPSPPDNSTNVSLNPILSVFVFDEDGDSMDVSFYNLYNNLQNITIYNKKKKKKKKKKITTKSTEKEKKKKK
jgi:hypothetical protein